MREDGNCQSLERMTLTFLVLFKTNNNFLTLKQPHKNLYLNGSKTNVVVYTNPIWRSVPKCLNTPLVHMSNII